MIGSILSDRENGLHGRRAQVKTSACRRFHGPVANVGKLPQQTGLEKEMGKGTEGRVLLKMLEPCWHTMKNPKESQRMETPCTRASAWILSIDWASCQLTGSFSRDERLE